MRQNSHSVVLIDSTSRPNTEAEFFLVSIIKKNYALAFLFKYFFWQNFTIDKSIEVLKKEARK
jgi:hypothetical protein